MSVAEELSSTSKKNINPENLIYFENLEKVLAYAEEKDYQGFSKFDAMNAPILESLFGWHPLTRLVWIQAVNRSPIHLRKIFGVKKSKNPKGIANFIKALSLTYQIKPSEHIKSEVGKLFKWQMENRAQAVLPECKDLKGLAWGYNFPWENPGFYAPRFFPNAIVSVFSAEAFLTAAKVFKEEQYLDAAKQTATFLLEELPILIDEKDKKCLGYVPRKLKLRVVNINSVIAGFLAKLYQETNQQYYLDEADKLINWVISLRTDYDSWFYTDPPTAYVRNHDNYHTGGILDGIYDYISVTKNKEITNIYMNGLEFYRKELFNSDGAPRWRNHKDYPHDIHGSAQGILSFVKAASLNNNYLDDAKRFADWALNNLQSPDGSFYYQQHRYFTMKFDLMRWNNSWMAWALAELCLELNKDN